MKEYLVIKAIEVEHIFVMAENEEQAKERAYEVEDIYLNGVEPGKEGLRDGEELHLIESLDESQFISDVIEQTGG